jgi:hypothetical protein
MGLILNKFVIFLRVKNVVRSNYGRRERDALLA